jgi:hypothetical protein
VGEIADANVEWTKATYMPLARCSTGNTSPALRGPLERLEVGMKASETNHSASMVAWTSPRHGGPWR